MNRPSTRTILVVDNDRGVVNALATRLGASGYTCCSAGSGSQALAQFQERPIDLVISDLNMPQGDGVTLAQSIRRMSNVPIILVSGFKADFRRRLRGIADVSFLHKPFESKELLDLVASALRPASTDSVPVAG